MTKAEKIKLKEEKKEAFRKLLPSNLRKEYSKEYNAGRKSKQKDYYLLHRERLLKSGKANTLRSIENLGNAYVKQRLRTQGLKNEQITPELIELKRITLKTTRLCRQLKN